MPGSGVPLLWNENAPAETDIADAAPIRSLETSLRNGLAVEHNWPNATAANFGYHLLGSCRPYYDVQSNVSSAGTDGRLMVTSDTSRLFHVGSAGTMLLGSAAMLSVGSLPVGGQRFYWAAEFGQAATGAAATGTVTFPNSGFSGVPFMWFYPLNVSAQINFNVGSPTATDAAVISRIAASALTLANVTFNWFSIGTRVL